MQQSVPRFKQYRYLQPIEQAQYDRLVADIEHQEKYLAVVRAARRRFQQRAIRREQRERRWQAKS